MKRLQLTDTCDLCEGAGCMACEGTGRVPTEMALDDFLRHVKAWVLSHVQGDRSVYA